MLGERGSTDGGFPRPLRELIIEALADGRRYKAREVRAVTKGSLRDVAMGLYRLVQDGVVEEGAYRGRRWYRLR
jgi:hypothetical protein